MTSLIVPRGNAPRSSGYRPGALLLSYRTGQAAGHRMKSRHEVGGAFESRRIALIRLELRLHSEPHRAKDKNQFRRLDPEAIWLVALAKEQLALITDYRFHNFPFVDG